jgi:hypothetical protein
VIETLINWIAGGFLLLAGFLFYKAILKSDRRKYADVIVSRYEDADYYYGKKGSEFDYGKPGSVWSQIVVRDNWTCYNCERKVYPVDVAKKKILWKKVRLPGRREVHVDHIVPYIYGGEGTLDNGRAACYRCNIRRKATIDRDCLKKVREQGKKIYLSRKVPKFKYERNRK